MGRKRKFSRQAEADPGAASSPATATATSPPSSRSDSATPFSPSFSFSKCVTLHNWWLIKSDTDSGGKRLAVGGLNSHGKYVRAFTSAPIVKRHNAHTLETADGITVQIMGYINMNRTHNNGIPLEVSRYFGTGFPFDWEEYAGGDFGDMSTSPTQWMGCSGIEKQRENLSDELSVCFDKLLNGLTSGIDASMNDESRKKSDFPRSNPSFSSSLNTALRSLLSSCSFRSPVASQPVETSRSHEMDKRNQNRENGVQCANLTGHEIVDNELHDGVGGESSAIANDTIAHLPTDMEEKLYDESERISVDVIVEGVSNDLSTEGHHQQTSRPENCAVNCQHLAEIERLHDVGVSQDLPQRKDSVGRDSDSLTGKVTSSLVVSSENCALNCQNHAEKARLQDICDPQDFPSRKDSIEKDSDATAGKVSSPLVALFDSPLPSAQRDKDNESIPSSLLKTGSIGLSPNVSGRLHLELGRRLGDYVLRSQNHAERIRVHGICESVVSAVRKDANRNETDSLSVNTDMALQTVFRSLPNDEDRKLDDNLTTSSAEPAVERASNSSVSTERDDLNNKLGRGRYALRSQDHARKMGVDNAGGSEGLGGRKYSKEKYANSMIEKNLPFEPLIMAPNKKSKGYNLRSEAKNESRSFKVKENFTTLGVFKQCEQIHVQSLITDGPQEANLLSAEEANSNYHSMTPASPDVINKKGADQSECNNSLRRSSRNESFKMHVQCSVQDAIHSVHAVRDDSDILSEITGKRIEKLPNDQDGNQSGALTEAQLTKQKTRKESRQKMVRRPNYSKVQYQWCSK